MSKYLGPNIKPSTTTILAYFEGFKINLNNFFDECFVTNDVIVPLSKKKKKIERKHIIAPYGNIYSMQKELEFRGVNTRKGKKYQCPKCMLWKDEEQESPLKTIEETITKVNDEDRYAVGWKCNNCNDEFTHHELGKLPYFLNCCSVFMRLKDHNINLMIFESCIKFAGCKGINECLEAAKILWEEYLYPNRDTYLMLNKEYIEYFAGINETVPLNFWLSLCMMNFNFKLGFPINKKRLNDILNDTVYSTDIKQSTINNTSGNISTIFSSNDRTAGWLTLTYEYDIENNDDSFRLGSQQDTYIDTTAQNPPESVFPKKKVDKKKKGVTAIVFRSSSIILSGYSRDIIDEKYKILMDIIDKHKSDILEKINESKQKLTL